MGFLAGPFVGAAALLALGGLLKLRVRALPTRLLAAAEVGVGLAALAFDTRLFPALVAAFYVGFAAYIAVNLTGEAATKDCGCFGETESPPTVLHLVVDLAAAAVAGAVAVGSGGGLSTALHGQPLGGVPFLLLAATTAGLAYAALAVLPRTLAASRR